MKKYLKKKYLTIGGVVIVVVLGGYFLLRPSTPVYTFIEAKKQTLTQEVSVTGHVKPERDANLALDVSGKVSWVGAQVGSRVSAGQTLVQLFNGDIEARLDEAKAALNNQQIKLEEIKKGTRAEEIQVYETRVSNATTALSDAQNNLRDSIQQSFTKSDDAIRSKADQFFSNPRSASPQLNLTTSDSYLKTELESNRLSIESMLIAWNTSLLTDKENINLAKSNVSQVNAFLDKLSLAINSLIPNSGLTQTTIDGYKANVFSARTNVNSATSGLSSAESILKTAQSNLDLAQRELSLKRAGATTDQIASQEALVAQAQANVNNYKAQLSKTILSSPMSGVVTQQDAKVGEIIQAGKTIVSVISLNKFKMETDIPEADIAKISLGDTAKVTLDAYGDEIIFEAKVVKIDPAEKIIEGVATYKTTLEFKEEDSRVLSGMTANIDIISEQKNDVIAIPQRAVTDTNGAKTVRILTEGNVEIRIVKTGLRGSDGNIEISEGLREGEKVITSTNTEN